MKFSVIITWYGHQSDRISSFNTLTKYILEQTLSRDNFELILVKDEEASLCNFSEIADKVISMPHRDLFCKSWFINNGARQASNEWLLSLDSDVSIGKDFFQDIFYFIDNTDTYVFQPFDKVIWEELDMNSYKVTNRIINHIPLDIFGLSFCMRKKEFFDTGGMCENFDGYGGEDSDIYERHKENKINMIYTLYHKYHARGRTHFDNNVNLAQICRTKTEEIKKRQIAIKDEIGNPQHRTLIEYKDLL